MGLRRTWVYLGGPWVDLGWILGVSGRILGGALGVLKMAENSENAVLRFWAFYPLISVFQVLSHMPNDRS